MWTALSTGSTGPNVARAQLALLDAGVVVRGGADGVFSVWTMYAVQTFQRSVGMSPTGVIDVETAQRLGLFDLDNPVATLPLVRLGSAGSAVAAAERALAAAGVRVADGVDGVFKIGDYYAVQTFQRTHGLPVTGVVDVATVELLDLYALPAPLTTWTNLALGATGPTVAAAERALVAAGVRVADGVDGVFQDRRLLRRADVPAHAQPGRHGRGRRADARAGSVCSPGGPRAGCCAERDRRPRAGGGGKHHHDH